MTEPEATLASSTTDYDVGLVSDAARESTEHSWLVSLSFWGTLLVAATLYASVSLAPKFCVWNRVRLQQHQNAERLSALETEVGYLERVEKALATDPEFRQQASGSASKADTDSELIPVSGNLLFGNHDTPVETNLQLATIPFYHSVAERLATDRFLRTSLLALTAFLTFFAFAVLNDAGTSFVVASKHAIQAAVAWPFRRYMQPVVMPSEDDAELPKPDALVTAKDAQQQNSPSPNQV